jgi:hypothetical protein
MQPFVTATLVVGMAHGPQFISPSGNIKAPLKGKGLNRSRGRALRQVVRSGEIKGGSCLKMQMTKSETRLFGPQGVLALPYRHPVDCRHIATDDFSLFRCMDFRKSRSCCELAS